MNRRKLIRQQCVRACLSWPAVLSLDMHNTLLILVQYLPGTIYYCFCNSNWMVNDILSMQVAAISYLIVVNFIIKANGVYKRNY